MTRATLAGMVVFSSIALGACHTESAWRAEVDRYNRLSASCDARRADLDRQLAAEKERVAGLENDLRRSSVQVEGMVGAIGDRERALADYRARAAQLERIKARFELLRHKL